MCAQGRTVENPRKDADQRIPECVRGEIPHDLLFFPEYGLMVMQWFCRGALSCEYALNACSVTGAFYEACVAERVGSISPAMIQHSPLRRCTDPICCSEQATGSLYRLLAGTEQCANPV